MIPQKFKNEVFEFEFDAPVKRATRLILKKEGKLLRDCRGFCFHRRIDINLETSPEELFNFDAQFYPSTLGMSIYLKPCLMDKFYNTISIEPFKNHFNFAYGFHLDNAPTFGAMQLVVMQMELMKKLGKKQGIKSQLYLYVEEPAAFFFITVPRQGNLLEHYNAGLKTIEELYNNAGQAVTSVN